MMYNRPTTDILQTLPRRSKLRPLSIASVTLLQIINSPVLDTLLNGGDIDLSKSLDLLTYLYLHTVEEDKAISLCLSYAENPNLLKNAVLLWAVGLSDDDFARLVADLIIDKDAVQNAQFEIDKEGEEEGNGKKKISNKASINLLLWLVAYVAKNTGWQEDSIRRMSFAKVLSYTHALLISEGIKTKFKHDGAKPRVQVSQSDFDALFN